MSRKSADLERVLPPREHPESSALANEEFRATWLRKSAAMIILSMLVLAIFAFVEFPAFTSASPGVQLTEGLMRLGVLTAAGVLGSYLVRHKDRPDLAGLKPDQPAPMPASMKELLHAEEYVVQHYGQDAIRYFAHMLLDLPSYLARVEEEFVPIHRNLLVKTALTFRTIEARTSSNTETRGTQTTLRSDQRILIPVLTAEQDRLVDSLAVYDASGKTLSLLPRWEVRGLITATLRMVFEQHVLRLPRAATESGLLDQAKDVLTWVLLDAVCAVGKRDVSMPQDGSEEEMTAQAAALKGLWELRHLGMLAETIWMMRHLCEILANHYLTVCEVAPSGGVNTVVKYSYTYPSQVVSGSRYERSRAKRGLDQCRFDLTMARTLDTDSYHLQFTAPESQYVHSHHLEKSDSTVARGDELTIAGVPQFVRHYHEEGRSVAHAHIRRQGIDSEVHSRAAPGVQPLTSVVRVREVPPGTLGSTVLLSMVTTVMIVFVALTRIGLDQQASNTNLPALLLAIPAFLAGTLGKSVDSARLARTPMLTYYGLSFTGGISFIAALLYVFDAASPLDTRITVHLFASNTLLHPDLPWTILSLASISLFLFLWREKRDQVAYYLDILHNSVDRNGSQ